MTAVTSGAISDWPARAAVLADAGKLTSPVWRAAVEAVPRHLFVPSFYVRRDGGMVLVAADDPATSGEWRDTVYSNTALVTKIAHDEADGPPVFLSSSSTPGLMTRMLEVLDVHDGQKVLEIGTGTGYHAALLSHRIGSPNVFSVDIEPDLVEAARARLADLGYHPTLLAGDGAEGLPEHAPFDRIIATCSVPAIPWTWVDQVRIGGVILTDLRIGLMAGNLVRLTRVSGNRAEGMFDAGQASFMELRHLPGPTGRVTYTYTADDSPVTESTTVLDPRTPWTNPVVWFLAALRIGGRYRLGYTGGAPPRDPHAVSLTIPNGSHAEIALATHDDGTHTVRETGPGRVWTHVEHAHQQWDAAGRPGWPRLGLAVTPDTQTIYVDQPDNTLATLTGAANLGDQPG